MVLALYLVARVRQGWRCGKSISNIGRPLHAACSLYVGEGETNPGSANPRLRRSDMTGGRYFRLRLVSVGLAL